MYKNILLNELNLEWNFDDSFTINQGDSNNYIEHLKKIDKLPLSKCCIYFSDNIWDFHEYTSLNVPRKDLKFNFIRNVDISYIDDLKSYVLIKILENNNKIQTIHRKFNEIRKLLFFLSSNNIYSVRDIRGLDITNYIYLNKHLSESSLKLLKGSIFDFLYIYSINFEDVISKEISEVLKQNNFGLYLATKEANKTPDIPEYFFDKLMKTFLFTTNNSIENNFLRQVGCMLLIISQTGLRPTDALLLKTDCIKVNKTFDNKKLYYLEYYTQKGAKHDNQLIKAFTYTNDITKLAVDVLLRITESTRKIIKTDYLYLGNINSKDKIPITAETFRKACIRYYACYNKMLDNTGNTDDIVKNKNLSPISIDAYKLRSYCKDTDDKLIFYPISKQYRVHVCTELYNKGVPLEYIKRFMAHLSDEMEGYYVRPKATTKQEDLEFSKGVILDIIKEEANPIGINSNGLVEKIKDFIRKNNFNIETDANKIANELLEKIPIRAKSGGVCIKSSMFRECSDDALTDEYYCAYGVCPNIFHFYYMANISYRQFKELINNIELSKKRNHLKQVQKETNMLKTIINKKLLPELDELKKMLSKKNSNEIINKYPDLEEIILNYNDIYKEALGWIE